MLFRHFGICQVNDEKAFLLYTYDKTFIKTGRIEGVRVSIDFGGQTITRNYSFDSAGNMIHVVTVDSKGKKKGELFLRYNHYGDIEFQKSIDYENNTEDSSLVERLYSNDKVVRETSKSPSYLKEYFYNKNGQIEKTHTTSDLVTTTQHFYDHKGNEIEQVWIQGSSRRVTRKTYYSQNKILDYKETFFGQSDTIGKVYLHKRYYYDEKGRVVKEEFLEGYSASENQTYEFTYDHNNRLIERKTGKDKESFTYDINGFLIKKEMPLFGNMKSIETYSYSIRQ